MKACIKIIENNCDPCGDLQNPTLHGSPERGTQTFGMRDMVRAEAGGKSGIGKTAKKYYSENKMKWTRRC